jgi:heat-inducible transcriptional repressor
MAMTTQAQNELGERDREILRGLVEAYLLSGEPVSSRQLAKRLRHRLSAASVRNVMADLDELGFLRQPHTSAGRIPTARGYHLFIDSLMRAEGPSAADRHLIDETLKSGQGDGASLPARVSSVLSQLSRQIGIMVTPDLGSTVLRAVEFVPLTGRKVLCVCVAANGFIEHKVVETDQAASREELLSVSSYLTENFAGLNLAQMRDRLLGMMAHERAQVDALMRRALELAQKGLPSASAPEPSLVVEGTETLLAQPELGSLDRVRRLFDTFNDKARVVGLLNRCLEGEGVRVVIGEESDLTSELDFSLIARRYETEGGAGTIGLFGPSRMEYARLIPLVDYLGERLTAALNATM